MTQQVFLQIITGTGSGNLYVWDGCRSVHAKHLVQVEEAHDLAVLACRFAPYAEGTNFCLFDLSFFKHGILQVAT